MSDEKKKSSKAWNIIWVVALVIVGVKRYNKNKVIDGPYAKEVKSYQDFQSKVASKRFSFIKLRKNPPKNISEQNDFNKKLNGCRFIITSNKGQFPVTLTPELGELIRSVSLSIDDFTVKQGTVFYFFQVIVFECSN